MEKTRGETVMLEMSKDNIGWPPLDRLDLGDMMADDLDNEIIPVFVEVPGVAAESYESPDEISRLGSIMGTGRPYSESDWTTGASSGYPHNPSEYNMVPPQNAGVPGNNPAMGYATHTLRNNSPMSYETRTPANSGQFAESGGRGFAPLLVHGGDYPIGANPLNQLQQPSSHPPERGRRQRSERRLHHHHHHHHHHHQTTGGFGGGQEGEGRRDPHSSSFPGEGRMEDGRSFP